MPKVNYSHEIGDIVYFFLPDDVTSKCDVCQKGIIILKGKRYSCPECKGTGKKVISKRDSTHKGFVKEIFIEIKKKGGDREIHYIITSDKKLYKIEESYVFKEYTTVSQYAEEFTRLNSK